MVQEHTLQASPHSLSRHPKNLRKPLNASHIGHDQYHPLQSILHISRKLSNEIDKTFSAYAHRLWNGLTGNGRSISIKEHILEEGKQLRLNV